MRRLFDRPCRRRVSLIVVAAAVLAACAGPVAGTATRSPGGPLTPAEVSTLVAAVVEAHSDLDSVTKTVVNRDPYSIDRFTVAEAVVRARVHRQISFHPTTSALYRIEEIRCLGDDNFATPVPDDLAIEPEDNHPWVHFADEPDEDAPDSARLVAYFCDQGHPAALDWDVEFLLASTRIADLGSGDPRGDPSRHLMVDIATTDAYRIPGMGWVGGDDVPDDGVDLVQVDIWVGADDLVRWLTSVLRVGGRALGPDISFGSFDEKVEIEAPNPLDVIPG